LLDEVLRILDSHPEVEAALQAARAGEPLVVEGLSGSFRAALLARLQLVTGRPLAVAVPGDVDLEALLLDLRAFHTAAGGEGQVINFPALGVDPYGHRAPHPDVVRERIQTLDRCAGGRAAVVSGTVLSWIERVQPRDRFMARSLHLEPGGRLSPDDLLQRLVEAGYRSHSLVESLGEVARRGGIVDVFPPTREHPVRVEFFGDEIDSIREFNPRDQRSMRTLEELDVPPAREHFSVGSSLSEEEPPGQVLTEEGRGLPDDPSSGRPETSLASYLDDALWVEVEPETLAAEAEEWWGQLDEHYHRALAEGHDAPLPEDLYVGVDAGLQRREAGRVVLRELAGPATAADAPAEGVRLQSQAAPSFRGRMADLAERLAGALEDDERVLFAMGRRGAAERLGEILEEYDVRVALDLPDEGDEPATARDETFVGQDAGGRGLEPGTCWVTVADLSAGFRVPELDLWVASDAEVFGRSRLRSRPRRFHGDAFRADFRHLEPGDWVVHVDHGIGRFVGVKRIAVGDDDREFMELEYAGDDRLYLPLEQLHLVQRYRGVEGSKPRVDKLGGTSWSKVKTRVKKELRDLANELLELYAARKTVPGRAFGEDTTWQREMEAAFEYEETPDQLTAIAEVKGDMEAPRPMDRLLCGDVGYGKTEVAMRAAFKAVMDGAQVAVLAPTTVLADQHSRTFRERMAAWPVKIELLSRFRSRAEQKEVLAGAADGTVDIVIGTHRLLSKDVRFKDPGLLVIDEEQRFGVSHKERLKQMRRQIDVLSMTATPIPRTLQMSLIGVRDLSVIESPPKDRFAVATHVLPYDPEVIAAAIREELAREGQVFFVHNRVETIYSMADRLRGLVPEAGYRVAHGQLPERELESVMMDFVDHEADVLVTTTIIENGLDIPRANTMVISRADRFGLAQLYQLRGRIGRSDRRASAYLLIPARDTLTPVARKRLRAIQEFADLGSGFRLAAMDLEIRGAGAMLGEKQHGHMAAVGFDMYARLLEETVRELKGQPAPSEMRAQLSLGIPLQIPPGYVEDPVQRLMVAKRLASARDQAQLDGLRDELRDRYGPMPSEVDELFDYADLRLLAEELGIQSVDRIAGELEIRFGRDPAVELDAVLGRVQEGDNGWKMKPPDRLVVPGAGEPPVTRLREVLESLLPA